MNRALAERVRASLRTGRSRGARVDKRLTAALRLVSLVGIVGALIALSVLRKHADDQLEHARAALLDTATKKRAQLSSDDLQTLDRLTTVLLHAPGPYEGDKLANEARGAGALSALLERPMIYVRGPEEAFRSDETLRRAALLSYADAFVRCLVDPPRTRTEKAYLERIRQASETDAPAARVHRLYDLVAGLPLLQTPWRDKVKAATELRELTSLDSELHMAKLDETIAAARARLVLFVMDESSAPTGLSELDGERAHDVRVTLFDLEQHAPLLRLRRHVDPAAFSDRGRASRATALDACALSLDVRDATTKGDTTTEAAR
ncbi:MAG TPA: hypothetical protein VH062_36925 [Polyangiaceae bacterium]|nr:hypothetical protein [Polyangiaceae bacterium]